MNLLSADWLPFRDRAGAIAYRPPAALADPAVIDLSLPRADFQGAAWQFLIGLLQTAFPPADTDEWLDRLLEPPAPADLETAFAPFADVFSVDGAGPRFMQDLDPLEEVAPATVGGLLIDSPGANGIRNNTDFFVKRGRVEAMCDACVALALYTMQINAPAGGAGIRVGLRGGGPLTTLVLPERDDASLWSRLWANVLPVDAVAQKGQTWRAPDPHDDSLFFWMAPTRVSDRKGTEILPEQVHPLHAYWSMPRRFRLVFKDEDPCRCDLCGRHTHRVVRQIRAKKQGPNYGGPWRHPLTPYRRDPSKPQEPPLSSKGQPGGLGYRHWPGLVLLDEEDSGALPARTVVHHMKVKAPLVALERRAGEDLEAVLKNARLWVFGYDMANMKPRGWYSVEMPLVAVPPESQEKLRGWIRQFVDLATNCAWMVRQQLREAWFKRPKDATGDMSQIDAQFFEATEPVFYRVLRRLGEALQIDESTKLPSSDIYRNWYIRLKREALTLFDDQALSGSPNSLKTDQLERVTRARRNLQGFLNGHGKGGKRVNAFAEQGRFELGVQSSGGREKKART